MANRGSGRERDRRGSDFADANVAVRVVDDGAGFGVARPYGPAARGRIHFARVDRDGGRRGAIRRVGASRADAQSPSLVFTETEYGPAWLDRNARTSRGRIRFARIGRDGSVVGAPHDLEEDVARWGPELAWSGHEYVRRLRHARRRGADRVARARGLRSTWLG